MKVRNLETRQFEEAIWDPVSMCWAFEPEGKDAVLQVQEQSPSDTEVFPE